jgi:orotidine-5'-phosphate decarboxylase
VPSELVDRFLAVSRANDSLLCVGLDIDPSRVPASLLDSPDWLVQFNAGIIEATADLVCAYKPNLAFYEALGLEGLRGLQATMELMPPHIPVIGDAKRSDIEHTASAYARAMFEVFGFDAITINAFPGRDGVEPFLARPDRGAFVWCRSSNPSAGELQDLRCSFHGQEVPFYKALALQSLAWNSRGNCGLVVGATYPGELAEVRDIAPDMLILVPGVGAQSGDLEASVRAGTDAHAERAIISASRNVIYASGGTDWQGAARARARELRDAINQARRNGAAA